VALNTGRRLSELAAMRWQAVTVEDDKVTIVWPRAMGGKVMRDCLALPVGRALLEWRDASGSDDAVWLSLAHDGSYGKPLSTRSIANVCLKYFGTAKVHSLRHSFTHAMEEAGAKVSDIQARLGHSNLATTGRYLASLRSADNQHAEVLASMFGMD
jgi:integrase